MACITKRGGRYVIDCYDQNGKRYRKTMKAGTTKEDTRKELREIETKIERRTFMHEKKTPLFSEVKKQWLEYKESRCRETTWEMYAGHCGVELKKRPKKRQAGRAQVNHFVDLDPKKIDRITTATIETFITAKQKENISLGTLRKIMVTLNQIMAYSVRHRFIDFNPVREAERPKATGKVDGTHEMRILSPDQIRALIEAEPDQKYRTLYLTAIMTGARQGELLGLRWSDVDLDKKQLHILRTFNHGRYFEPKTKGSIRKIDMAPVVVKELASWKLASGGRGEDLVFPSGDGTPLICHNMKNRHFFPALKAAEIEAIRFHDLRHTYASLMLAQGENVKYIQTQLGHSSPTVTLNVYSHLLKETNQEAVCRLENTIFQATGHNLVTNEKNGQAVNA
jgi:integrase